ncbi:MAG: NADH-quinone oxidoreductase subunit NuoH [bacterium]
MEIPELIITTVKIIIVIFIILTAVAYYTFAERKLGGWIQDRVGPNRAGPWGLLQPLADGVKFFFKEDVIPLNVDKPLYVIAPLITLIPALITFAVVPFGNRVTLFGHTIRLQIADVNIGILYILAVASLGIYGIVLAGWASNNKFSLLGAVRSSAQMVSYELSLALSIIGVLMVFETLRLNQIVVHQGQMLEWAPFLPRWGVFVQPLGFLVFLVAAFAETNRIPFDLPEGEAELVAGYHTEYGSMKFAFFFMGEYANMITSAAVTATLFFGGWQVPCLDWSAFSPPAAALIQIASFSAKTLFFAFLFIWVRWTIPRFRYDQLMRLGWKVLLPLALLNILVTGAIYVVKNA